MPNMSWTDWIVSSDNLKVALPVNILKLIAQVEHNAGVDYAAAIRRVTEYLKNPAGGATIVQTAIATLGLTDGDLQAEWQSWSKLVSSALPEPLRPLAVPMAELTKPVEVPLVSRSAGGNFQLANMPFAWGVKADASASAEVMNVEALRKAKLDVALGDSQIALRLSLHGGLGANVGGKLNQTWGTVAAAAKAHGSADLDLYSRQAGNNVLLAGLLESLTAFPLLGDLSAALQSSTTDRFAQMRTGLRGGLAAQGSITVGLKSSTELGALGSSPVGLDLAADVELGATYSRDGAYILIAEPGSGGGLHVRIEQSTKTSVGTSLELGVNVAVTGLAEAANPYLEKWLPDDAKLLATINSKIDFPKLLRNELAKIPWLSDAKLQELVQQILTSGLSPADAAAKATDWLNDKVMNWIHSSVPWLTGSPEDIAQTVSAQLLGSLKINNVAIGNAITSAIAKTITDAQKKADGEIKTLSSDLAGLAKSKLVELLAPVVRIGNDAASLATSAKNNANALVAPLKQWLDEYAALRKRIIDGVAKVTEAKLGIKFAAGISSEKTSALVFAATFLKHTDTSELLYRSLWAGRLFNLRDLLGRAVAEGSVYKPEGMLTAIASGKSTSALSIQFLGSEFKATTLQYHDVRIETDFVTGRIAVVTGSAKIESKSFNAWHEQFMNTLGVDVDLLHGVAKDDANAPLVSSFSLRDEQLYPEEVDEFVDSLARFGVARPEAKAGLYDQMSVNALAHGSFLRDVTLGVAFQLDNKEFRRALAIDRRSVIDVAFPTIFGFLRTVAGGTSELVWCETLLDRAGRLVTATGNRTIAEGVANMVQSDVLPYLAQGGHGLASLDAPISAAKSDPIHRGASWLWTCCKQAVGIAYAFEDLSEAIKIAQSGATAEAMQPKLTKLMKNVASSRDLAFSVFSREAFFNKNEVPWVTLGFYVTMAKLLDRPAPFGVVVTALVPGPSGDKAFIVA
jgi:hypothetical protein